MAFTVTREDRRTIEDALWFANLASIKSAEQIEARYKLGFGMNDQPEVRRWFDAVIAGRGIPDEVTLAEINVRAEAKLRPVLRLRGGELVTQFLVDSVAAANVHAIVLILTHRLGERLTKCRHCDRYVLDISPKGRPKAYCSEAHREAFHAADAADRMRAWRKRQKRKEASK